jgi:hypothetical protein
MNWIAEWDKKSLVYHYNKSCFRAALVVLFRLNTISLLSAAGRIAYIQILILITRRLPWLDARPVYF